MAANPELRTAHRLVDELHRELSGLVARYGDSPAVRRLTNDVERLRIDMEDLDHVRAQRGTAPEPQIRAVADEQIDPAAWADADDEGVGGYHGTTR